MTVSCCLESLFLFSFFLLGGEEEGKFDGRISGSLAEVVGKESWRGSLGRLMALFSRELPYL